MAIDRDKALATAQKHLEKGKLDKALAVYQTLVEDDPKDVRVWQKIADLKVQKGAPLEAAQAYARIAQQHREAGFYLKAVAAYKQVLALDPYAGDVKPKLKELYLKLGLLTEADRT